MTTIKHRIPNKNVRKRIYQIYIYIICFIQGKENFQSDYFAIISRCERKKYLLPCQNMLIKSNSTRAKRRGKKIVYGEKPIDVNDLWSKKDRAHHTWTRRGRRQGIVALTHMTMYRVSRHAAFPCFAPFAFQNDVRVSFMCHSCGATSFSNSIPRYLQSSTYIYIYMYRWPMFSRQQATIPHLPFPSDETSIRVHCLVLDLRFLCNLCCENLSIVIWNLLFDHSFGSKEG